MASGYLLRQCRFNLSAEYKMTDNSIISEMADYADVDEIKKTRKNELWISLDQGQYAVVLDHLLHDKKYKHLRWETRRGSKKSKIWDEDTGMTLILKSGDGAYLWCTVRGSN